MASYSAYRTGTVIVTNGSTAITGSGTSWNDTNASAGSIITIDGVDYTIETRNSTTSITLATPYAGATASGVAYIIAWLKDPTPLTANETPTINEGLTVEITTSAWSALGANTVQVLGRLLLRPPAGTTMKFLLYAATTRIFITGTGEFVTEGAWHEVGTGTGESGQTHTIWDGDFCPCVWVETAQDSGVYEKYLNLSTAISHANAHTFAAVGAGDYGRFFTQAQDSTTITFGDGTNGKVPPAGAKIRVPNLIVSYVAARSTASQIIYSSQFLGDFLVTRTQFSRHKLEAKSPKFSLTETSLPAIYGIGIVSAYTATDCGMAPYGDPTNANEFVNLGASPRAVLVNCALWGRSTGYGAAMTPSTGTSVSEFYDCQLYGLIGSTGGGGVAVNAQGTSSGSLTIDGGLTVGAIKASGSLKVTNHTNVNIPFGVDASSSGAKAIDHVGSGPCDVLVKNLTVPVGGGGIGGIAIRFGTARVVRIENVTINSTGYSDIVGAQSGTPVVSEKIEIINVYAASGACGGIPATTPSLLMQRYRFGTAGLITTSANAFVGAILKGVMIGDTQFPGGASQFNVIGQDTLFYELWKGNTGFGFLAVRGNYITTPTPYVTLSAQVRPTANNPHAFYTTALGQSVVWEWPHRILGVTAFRDATPELGMTGSVGATVEYAIDIGGGYSAWKELTTANLLDENATLPPATTGFRIKIRWNCGTPGQNGAALSSSFGSTTIQTLVDQTVQYPTAFVNLKLRNLKPGSRWRIVKLDESDAEVEALGSGVAGEDGLAEVQNVPYFDAFNIGIRARQSTSLPKYQPYETIQRVTENGLDFRVSQVADSIVA